MKGEEKVELCEMFDVMNEKNAHKEMKMRKRKERGCLAHHHIEMLYLNLHDNS